MVIAPSAGELDRDASRVAARMRNYDYDYYCDYEKLQTHCELRTCASSASFTRSSLHNTALIELDGHHLSIDELWRVACHNSPCALASDARPLIRRSRELVESLAAQPRAIYGINTGFGPLSGFRISNGELGQHQLNLLHHLTVGQGPLFSPAETRAIMLARANALARGYSGIREELIELLLAALNRGVLPEIPSEGSVGASGDLVPLAHMAGSAGRARPRAVERRTSAGRRGVAQGRADAGGAAMQGRPGAGQRHFGDDRPGRAWRRMKRRGCCAGWNCSRPACFKRSDGEPEVLCASRSTRRAAFAANHSWRGASAIRCARILILRGASTSISGVRMPKPVDGGAEIQDPYSLRCAPQILGAFQEAHWHVEQVVTRELNASTDNPLDLSRQRRW